jgi:hypothetical protein
MAPACRSWVIAACVDTSIAPVVGFAALKKVISVPRIPFVFAAWFRWLTTLIRGKPGAVVELIVRYRGGRGHLACRFVEAHRAWPPQFSCRWVRSAGDV